ncbi:MAG: Crp/Fnr family transcriptional regulator [Bacteroidetes bacterium]|nr:Crp/Fnr family transcriptional regulator [Bacteroidota bacterium]
MFDVNMVRHDCNSCLFKALSCQYLEAEEFEVIRRTSVPLRFKKGETIVKQGGRSTHLVFLHHGMVKFNYEVDDGKNVILTIVTGPKLLGGANLFFRMTNIFSLVAVENCDICLIDSRVFMSQLVDQGKYLLTLFERTTEMFEASIFNFISLAYKQVNGRIADVLIYLADHVYKNDEFLLTLTRKEIAEFAACSHENVINHLSKLNKEGVISLEGKVLKILDRDKLREISKHG